MSEHKLLKLTLDDVARMAAKGHSAFSPSGSKMWLTCLGSLIPNILADDDSSAEAAEGTVAHGIAEEWIRTGKRPKGIVGLVEIVDDHEIEITDEMMAYVGDYVAYVQELEEDAVEFLVETRVDFSDLTPIPDQGGTADSIAVLPIENSEFEIVVTDLKFGKGVRVIAEGNTQGRLYGYGAFRLFRDRYNITRLRVRICHPRLHGGTTETTISIEELLEWTAWAKERAHDAWRFDAPRTPSVDGCQWCKVKATCAAVKAHLAEVTSGVFDEDDEDEHREYTQEEQAATNEELEDDLGGPAFRPADPVRLSTAALARVLRYRKLMENFFNSVEAELLTRATSAEEDIPGWKIVEGRTRRKWPENELVVALKLKRAGLKDSSIFTTDMISPAEAEKKLHGKAGLSTEEAAKLVNSLAVRPRGNRSLVRRTDTRPAAIKSGEVFADDDD